MTDYRTETISIQGCRSGQVPTTVGLRSIWTSIEDLMPDTSFYNTTFPVEVGPGVDLGRLFAALRTLVTRHDSLRSHFFRDAEGTLVQRVCDEGEVLVEVCEARSEQDRDFPALMYEMEAKLRRRGFDNKAELPTRMGICVVDGEPRGVMLCASHAAADMGGLQVLARELVTLVQGGHLEEPAVQPADLAAWERSPVGLGVQQRALRYWRRELRAMPSDLLKAKYATPETPRYPNRWLRSKAVALAVDVLGARCRVSGSAVLLAATAFLFGQAAQEPRVTLQLISANRSRRMLRDYVGNVCQGVLAGIDVTGPDFAAVARSAFSASVQAYRNTHCERAETEQMRVAESAERGAEVEMKYFFNDVRPYIGSTSPVRVASAEEVRAALTESRAGAGEDAEHDDIATFFRVLALGEESIELTLRADTLRLRSEEIEEFLLRLEALLVAAVELGVDTDPRRLLEQSGPTASPSGT